MTEEEEARDIRSLARRLTSIFDELLRSVARVDPGQPEAAQLTLQQIQILLALEEAPGASSLHALAASADLSVGQIGQVAVRLIGLRLVERVGGGRGPDRTFTLTSQGRRVLRQLESARARALEGFVARLNERERMRMQGAVHLLGGDLDRLSRGIFAR